MLNDLLLNPELTFFYRVKKHKAIFLFGKFPQQNLTQEKYILIKSRNIFLSISRIV